MRNGVKTGIWLLKRGAKSHRFADQFSFEMDEEERAVVTRHTSEQTRLSRSERVRKRVLERANGRCEWCGAPGFMTPDNEIFLETHHVQPLSQDGDDKESNVIALCPNHHREAHLGANPEWMKSAMLQRIQERRKRR